MQHNGKIMTPAGHVKSYSILFLERAVAAFFMVSLMVPLSRAVGPAWTRVYFWDFGLAALYILWFLRTSRTNPRLKIRPFDILLIVFLIWLLLSNIQGLRPRLSLEPWLLWFRGGLIYFYFSRNIGRVISVRFMFKLIVTLVLVEGVLCIVQMVTNTNVGQLSQYFGEYSSEKVPYFSFAGRRFLRSPGTFYNTGIVAVWMVMLLPALLAYYFFEAKKKSFRYLLVWGVGLVGAFSTLSRVEMTSIGLAVMLVLFWARPIRFSAEHLLVLKKKPFIFTVVVILIAIMLLSALMYLGYWDAFYERLRDFSGRFERKFAYMSSALSLMGMYPLMGVGQGNFGVQLRDTGFHYYIQGEGVVHNIPLLIGTEAGVIGFVLFIILLLFPVVRGWRAIRIKRPEKWQVLSGGMAIGLICYIFDMQWTAGLIHHSVQPLFFVCLGLAMATVKNKEENAHKENADE